MSLHASWMASGLECLSAEEIRSSMASKKTRVVLAADRTTIAEISMVLSLAGPNICMLKTHADGVVDFDYARWMDEVVRPARKMGILIFEDRKFADIGHVSKIQMLGHQRIADWADIVTAHRISGPDIINGIHAAWSEVGRRGSILILAQMSSSGNFLDSQYTRKTVDSCKSIPGVCGFIGNGSDPTSIAALREAVGPEKLILTPGINLTPNESVMGQRYGHPSEAIRSGADAVIVGSGIIRSDSVSDAAALYAKATMDEM